MSTAYTIEKPCFLRKRRIVCAIFAQAIDNLLRQNIARVYSELCLLFTDSKSCVLEAHDIAPECFPLQGNAQISLVALPLTATDAAEFCFGLILHANISAL